jgi:hypothetical protein
MTRKASGRRNIPRDDVKRNYIVVVVSANDKAAFEAMAAERQVSISKLARSLMFGRELADS